MYESGVLLPFPQLLMEMPELMSFSAVKKDKTAFVTQRVCVPESSGFFLYCGDWNLTPNHAAVNKLSLQSCYFWPASWWSRKTFLPHQTAQVVKSCCSAL